MVRSLLALAAGSAVWLSACSVVIGRDAPVQIRGDIDARFLEEVRKAVLAESPVLVSSGGGNAQQAWLSAQFIQAGRSDIIITETCLSACAEFLMPAASSLTIQTNSLIGFHGNDLIFEQLRSEFFPDAVSVIDDRIAWIRSAYADRSLKISFSREVRRRLAIRFVALVYEGRAPRITIYSVNTMWFPTSQQLRTELGLLIDTPLCSDDRACWIPRLERLGKPGEQFVVGDEVARIQDDGSVTILPWVPTEEVISVVGPR